MNEGVSRNEPLVQLTGQVALVTGASSGLGERFARVLADEGASVALAARRADRLEALAADIRAAGGAAQAFALDLADAASIEACVAAVEAALGRIDILVNSGGAVDIAPAKSQRIAAIDAMLAVNVRGTFLMAREAARGMIVRGDGGRIINIASLAAHHYDGQAPGAMYAATKAAVVRMTEALAVEWARHGINVNSISPGLFRSEMSATAIESHGEAIRRGYPRARFGEPHHLDSTLLYLASPASEFVTGTDIKVDDGQNPR